MGPGSYSADEFNPVGHFSHREVHRKASGPGWARAYEVSRMAALPHLLHKEQWEKKRILEKNLGPGTYHIKDFLHTLSDKPRSTRGICQTKERRFKDTATVSVQKEGKERFAHTGRILTGLITNYDFVSLKLKFKRLFFQ